MIRQSVIKLLIPLFLLPLTLALAIPPAQDNTCPLLVNQALEDVGQNCNLLGRNSVCYGFNQVSATFTEPQPDNYFSQVSDRSALTLVDTLETAPLDVSSSTWGVAVLKVQANVPNSLPGQAVTFVLLGDTEVRNDVPAADAFTPVDPVDVTVIGSVNVRSSPSLRANVLGSVPDGTTLSADGRSSDGDWLRVLYNDAPGWVSAALVNAPDAADSLPTITNDLRTPMQAFSVKTGVNSTNCQEAPNVLVVQGPDTMTVNLTINGAEVTIGSTIALFSTEFTYNDLLNNEQLVSQFGSLLTGHNVPGDLKCTLTQIIIVDGHGEINNGGLNLPTGFTARSINCGGPDRSSGFITPWGGSRPLTSEELGWLQTLNNLPPGILNYPIHVPTLQDIQNILQIFNGAGGSSAPAVFGPAANQVNCSTLKPTSPLGTMPGKDTPFYWDAANGATSYTVRVYDSGGTLVGEYSVNAPQTTLTANPQGKDNMSWDVSAYVNGTLACTSARVSVLRDTVYQSAAPSPGYTYFCNSYMNYPPDCPAACTRVGSCGAYLKDNLCRCPSQ